MMGASEMTSFTLNLISYTTSAWYNSKCALMKINIPKISLSNERDRTGNYKNYKGEIICPRLDNQDQKDILKLCI